MKRTTGHFVFSTLLFILFLAGGSFSLYAQSLRVTGTVKDDKGTPLAGAVVKLKGTTQQTATDNNGKFTIPVPGPEAVLEFSYVGFEAADEIIGQRKQLDVIMTSTGGNLNDIVVVGYG